MKRVPWAIHQLETRREYVVLMIWLTAIGISSMPILCWTRYSLDLNAQICLLDASPENIFVNTPFTITHVLICVIVPAVAFGISYAGVYEVAKTDGHYAKEKKRARQIVGKCIYFVLAFVICRLPYSVASVTWS